MCITGYCLNDNVLENALWTTSTLPSISHLDNITQVTITTSLTQGLTNMPSHSSLVLAEYETTRHYCTSITQCGPEWPHRKPNHFDSTTHNACITRHFFTTTLSFYISFALPTTPSECTPHLPNIRLLMLGNIASKNRQQTNRNTKN